MHLDRPRVATCLHVAFARVARDSGAYEEAPTLEFGRAGVQPTYARHVQPIYAYSEQSNISTHQHGIRPEEALSKPDQP